MSKTRRKTGSRILGILMSVVLAFGLTPGLAFAEVTAGEPVLGTEDEGAPQYSVEITTEKFNDATLRIPYRSNNMSYDSSTANLPEGVSKPSWRLEGLPEGVLDTGRGFAYAEEGPQQAGTFQVSVTAYCEVDGAEVVLATKEVPFLVADPNPPAPQYSVEITTEKFNDATLRIPYRSNNMSYDSSTANLPEGVSKPSWRLEGLPEGVLDTGRGFAYAEEGPQQAGTFQVSVTAYCEVDGAEVVLATKEVPFLVVDPNPQGEYSIDITTEALEPALTGEHYNGYVHFENGKYPAGVQKPSWHVTGLPEGIELYREANDLVQVAGIAAEEGAFDVTFTAFVEVDGNEVVLAEKTYVLVVTKGAMAKLDGWDSSSMVFAYSCPTDDEQSYIACETTANMPADATVSIECEDLPAGLVAADETVGGMMANSYRLYITGTPQVAGDFKVTARVFAIVNGEKLLACEGEVDCKIVPVQLKRASATVESADGIAYAGAPAQPNVVVHYGQFGEIVVEGGYTVEYANNDKAGEATATVVGDGVRVTGSITKTFSILPGQISECTIDAIPDQVDTGAAIEPELTVKCGENVLVKDVDFTVAYANNTAPGTATATVTGKEGKFEGSKDIEFQITLSEADAKAVADVEAVVMDLPDAAAIAASDDEALKKVDDAVAAYLALSDAAKAQVSPATVAALVNASNAASQVKAAKAKAAEAAAALAQEAQKAAEQKALQASGLKANPMDVKAKAVKAKAKKKTTIKKVKAFEVTGAVGKVSFYKIKGNVKINVKANGKVVVKKGLKAKKKPYKVKVLVCAAGDKSTAPAMKMVTLKVKVSK